MRIIRSASLVFVLLTAAGTAHAREWTVGNDPGDDFSQIQPAIDAATPGDLILIRDGHYLAFALNKGVTVRALDAPFEVDQTVAVGQIPVDQRAMLSGATINAMLYVVDSPGAIVLERIRLLPSQAACLEIHDCDDVAIVGLYARGLPPFWQADTDTAVTIVRSHVRLTGFQIHGNDGVQVDPWGTDGAAGMAIQSATVILARGSVWGGRGSDGDPWADSNGGDGGVGILVGHDADLYLIGTTEYLVRGGDGGTVYYDAWWDYWYGVPGRGGDGLVVRGNGSGLVSRVRLEGGQGGHGEQDAPDGDPWTGNVQRDDTLPWLMTSGPLSPGSSVTIDIDSTGRPAVGILLLAESSGFLYDASLEGIPYFTSVPGGWFFALPIGHTDGAGAIQLVGLIPPDPALAGWRLDLQALMLGDDASRAVTNGVCRVLGR